MNTDLARFQFVFHQMGINTPPYEASPPDEPPYKSHDKVQRMDVANATFYFSMDGEYLGVQLHT